MKKIFLIAILFAPLLASGCFSSAMTAEKLNQGRLAVKAAKDAEANIYAPEDFELAARHCGRGEQAFWAGYNRKGFDLARMCIADADTAMWRSKWRKLQSMQSRLREEIDTLKKDLSPFYPEKEITRQLTIIKEKISQ